MDNTSHDFIPSRRFKIFSIFSFFNVSLLRSKQISEMAKYNRVRLRNKCDGSGERAKPINHKTAVRHLPYGSQWLQRGTIIVAPTIPMETQCVARSLLRADTSNAMIILYGKRRSASKFYADR